MTTDEFFTDLAALPRDLYPFQIDCFGRIRCLIAGRCLCPIEVLYFVKTGLVFYSCIPYGLLGLTEETARRIMRAADIDDGDVFQARRARMLSALGLQEAA